MRALGETFFPLRAVVAGVWILVLVIFSHPLLTWWSALLFLPGLGLRFWAAGFIGPVSRNPKITTDSLVTRGPYSLSRHPLYIGNALLVAVGLALLRPHWILIVLTAAGFVALYIMIGIAEERKLEERYGEEYRRYRRRVTPLFPLRYEGPLCKGFNGNWALHEWQTWLAVGALYFFAFLRANVVPWAINSITESTGWTPDVQLTVIKTLVRVLFLLLR